MKNKGSRRSPLSKPTRPKPEVEDSGSSSLRLNQHIARSGVCSRREADELIKAGQVSVNGKKVTELGTRVSSRDKVEYQGKTLRPERLVYILLNKPKDFITTTSDPQERKTVMQLVQKACPERVYPVGRLDRNTTGLLLFTNDGEMAEKLAHPSYRIRKVYQVDLDRPINNQDLEKITSGVELEDGLAQVDDLALLDDGRKSVGIEIHLGKNRIVRRIFESLGYDVVKLDRVIYASLTKKDLTRGKWRFLKPREVSILRMSKK